MTFRCLASLVLAGLLPAVAWSEVVRYEISERRPFAAGQSFDEVGAYELIVGRVFYEIDPEAAANRAIVDLPHAPRTADGRVEFSGDLFILAPADPSKGNGAALYDVNNRGGKLALRFFNDAAAGNDAKDPGNGFLMRQGYTVVWSGWDGELLPGGGRLRLLAPVARRGEEEIVGPVRYEIAADKRQNRLPVSRAGHGGYRPTAKGLESATLSWRVRPEDPRVPIPRDQFAIHVTEEADAPPQQLPKIEVEIFSGFQPGYLYELIYEARGPLVHGVCFAGLRDLISSLKHGGGEGHPLLSGGKPVIRRAIGFGVSQSGRFLREMLHAGFNADEQGQIVFEGMIPHVAGGGLGSFNHRFAQPTAFVTQYELHDWPTDRFPFSYETQVDPLSGAEDGILRQAARYNRAKVLHTQTSVEYWSRSGSLVHTDPLGKQDGTLPENVRVYAFGGCQHGVTSFPPEAGEGQLPANPADYRPQLRALLTALESWCREDAAPPSSVYPRIADGTLVAFEQSATGFPRIPGVRYPERIQRPSWLDFGTRWAAEGIIDQQPPRSRGEYQVLVPKSGPDGNDLGALLPIEVQAPLATFTGWNLRAASPGPLNELVGLNGAYVPLAATEQQRKANGDPRRSLEQRYGDVESYVKLVTERCRAMADKGYLLDEDIERIVTRQKERAEQQFKAAGE